MKLHGLFAVIVVILFFAFVATILPDFLAYSSQSFTGSAVSDSFIDPLPIIALMVAIVVFAALAAFSASSSKKEEIEKKKKELEKKLEMHEELHF